MAAAEQLDGAGEVRSYRVGSDFLPDADEAKGVWAGVPEGAMIDTDWQGRQQYPELATTVKSVWSEGYLYLLYVAKFDELAIDRSLPTSEQGKTAYIWNHDVVEVFVTGEEDVRRYREFVVSPIGQRIDIAHDRTLEGDAGSDWQWLSGWETVARIEESRGVWVAEFRVGFEALGVGRPTAGMRLRANLFRCSHTGERQKYLAWQATGTAVAQFHVPEKFGVLRLMAAAEALG